MGCAAQSVEGGMAEESDSGRNEFSTSFQDQIPQKDLAGSPFA